MYLRVAGAVPESIVDGPGIRYTVFAKVAAAVPVATTQTHPLDGGEKVAVEDLLKTSRAGSCSGGHSAGTFPAAGPLAYLGRQSDKWV